MEYQIRECNRNDSYAIAHVVTISWNETYKGIVPDDFLNELKKNEQMRGKLAYDSFDLNGYHEFVLEANKEVVGFVRYGKSQDKDFDNCGEIIALYIIKEYHGLGFGKKLVEKVKEKFKEDGFDKMIIACLKGNPTNEFYKHIGGKYVKDGMFERLKLKENIYLYDLKD